MVLQAVSLTLHHSDVSVAICNLCAWLTSQTERKKNTETFHRLNDAVVLLDKQVDVMKKENDKILSAEIQSRCVL